MTRDDHRRFVRFECDLRYHSFYWDLMNEIGFCQNLPLQRICSLMRKSNAKAYLLEELDISSNNDFLQEKNDLDTHFDKAGDLIIHRLSFFSNNRLIDASQQEIKCLCSAVLFTYENEALNEVSKDKKCKYVYEAILSHPHKYNICEKERGQSYICKTWLLNNYIHTSKEFDVNINCELIGDDKDTLHNFNRTFKIRGTYFCQQNQYTSVCAHSSLKMLINSIDLSQDQVEENIHKQDFQKKLTTHKINEELNESQTHKIEPSEGITVENLTKILEIYGLKTFKYNFADSKNLVENVQYQDILHTFIENGPAFIIFKTKKNLHKHIMTVVGHTFNSDEWFPEAHAGYVKSIGAERYFPSSKWIDHFIIHDDNFGMYYNMGTTCLRNANTKSKFNILKRFKDKIMRSPSDNSDNDIQIHSIIGVTQKKINISPFRIEQIASILIYQKIKNILAKKIKSNVWVNKLVEVVNKTENMNRGDVLEKLVLRTIMVKREDYLSHLKAMFDNANDRLKAVSQDGKDIRNITTKQEEFDQTSFDALITKLETNLPPEFWMIEFSLTNLYTANKAKLGEILLSNDKTIKETLYNEELLIAFRGPEFMYFYHNEGTGKKRNGSEVIMNSLNSHSGLFRNNNNSDHSLFCEW